MRSTAGRTAARVSTIAIIDTGIDTDHPEFSEPRKIVEPALIFPSTIVTGDPRVAEDDSSGHGTIVASLAAGGGYDGNDILGIAPAAQIMPIRWGRPSLLVIARSIEYAISHGADVINMSFGLAPTEDNIKSVSSIVGSSIQRALDSNIHVVVTAGNRKTDYTGLNAYAHLDAGLWVVGASTVGGERRADFSLTGVST